MGDIEINHLNDEHTANRTDISSPDELGSLNGDRCERKYPDVIEIESQDETDSTSNSRLSEYNDSHNGSNVVIANPNQHSQTHGEPEPDRHEPRIENIAVANSSRITVGDRAITRVSGSVIYNRYHIQQINNSDSNDQSK